MSSNQFVVFEGPGEVTLRPDDVPDPGPEEVLIETTRSAISVGTELTILSGDYPEGGNWDEYGEYPFDAGYCNVGEVIEAGEDVDDDIVGTMVVTRSPHCRYHTVRYEQGVPFGGVVPVPDAVPAEEAAFFALGAIAMNGVRRGRVDWGETAAIYGCGIVGQLTLRFARAAGARPVVGFDIREDRRALLPNDPAVTGADPEGTDPVAAVEAAGHGRLADVVFEATGLGSVVPREFEVLRDLGRLVVLSSPREETTLDLSDHCNWPSYEIIGAHEGSHPPAETPQNPWTHGRHFELFFDLIADGEINVGSLITHRVSFDDAPEFYEQLLDDRSEALGVVIEYDG